MKKNTRPSTHPRSSKWNLRNIFNRQYMNNMNVDYLIEKFEEEVSKKESMEYDRRLLKLVTKTLCSKDGAKTILESFRGFDAAWKFFEDFLEANPGKINLRNHDNINCYAREYSQFGGHIHCTVQIFASTPARKEWFITSFPQGKNVYGRTLLY